MIDSKRSRLAFQVDELQASGRYTFTRAEVDPCGGRSEVSIQAALRRLKQQGRIASPRRGFYVIVPLEYRSVGCPPASWFIHDLMRFLNQPYYVGLLSAAAIHSAAHQQPMIFQVITDRPTQEVRVGRVRIEFRMNRNAGLTPTLDVQTETGHMRVSTPEGTAYDLVRYAAAAGHLSNVATVLTELAEKVDGRALLKLASSYQVPEVQRLGYLLDLVGEYYFADLLSSWLGSRRYRPVPLVPGMKIGREEINPRWRIIQNLAVEADLPRTDRHSSSSYAVLRPGVHWNSEAGSRGLSVRDSAVKLQRVYMDTSVIGGCFDAEFAPWSNGLMKDFRLGYILPVVSQLVAAEIEPAPERIRGKYGELLSLGAEVLPDTDDARLLVQEYLAHDIVPRTFEADALHIAIATVAAVDLLVSWNFAHIVRFDRIRMFNAVNRELGYKELEIYSPREVAHEEEE